MPTYLTEATRPWSHLQNTEVRRNVTELPFRVDKNTGAGTTSARTGSRKHLPPHVPDDKSDGVNKDEEGDVRLHS